MGYILDSIIIILLLFWIFFKSYFNKKGENFATKEDIEKITNIVESTKNIYIAKIEEIKANFNVYSDSNSKIQEHARNALITFYEDCVLLITDKLFFNFGNFPVDDCGKALFDHQQSTSKLFTKIAADHYRLLLYFKGSEEIKQASIKVVIQMAEIAIVFNNNFGDVKIALINNMVYLTKHKDHPDITEEQDDTLPVVLNKFSDMINPKINEFKRAFQEYMDVVNKKIGVNDDFFNQLFKS